MNAKTIHSVGSDRFYVQSVTDPSHKYLMDLGKQSCDCPDWPRVQLCKHITAVAHFFGHKDQQIEVVPAVPKSAPLSHPPIWEDSPGERSDASASILQNVINVSKDFLSDSAPSSPGTVKSLQMVEAHLTAIIHNSRTSDSPLPDKESIPPNQCMWTKTTERMGATRQRSNPTLTPHHPLKPTNPWQQHGLVSSITSNRRSNLQTHTAAESSLAEMLHQTHKLQDRMQKRRHRLQPQPTPYPLPLPHSLWNGASTWAPHLLPLLLPPLLCGTPFLPHFLDTLHITCPSLCTGHMATSPPPKLTAYPHNSVFANFHVYRLLLLCNYNTIFII
jgi:hypothetical protein